MVPEIWGVMHRIICHFVPFFARKNQNFEKMKKTPGDIILHKCTKNYDHTMYDKIQILFFILGYILLFYPPND